MTYTQVYRNIFRKCLCHSNGNNFPYNKDYHHIYPKYSNNFDNMAQIYRIGFLFCILYNIHCVSPVAGFFYLDGVRQNCYQLIEFNGDYYFINDGHKLLRKQTDMHIFSYRIIHQN